MYFINISHEYRFSFRNNDFVYKALSMMMKIDVS